MSLNSLLLSADEKTVHILRRVLSDLEIGVEHCSASDVAIRLITRQRFEAIIVDGQLAEQAAIVMRGVKASPVNKRALAIVLVEADVGLKGGFEMGAHFVLHKPFAVERAKPSFRAVRALMKRERRLQMRIPVEIPVECFGSSHYSAKTVDLSEGGMAIRFSGRAAKESPLRFSLDLPGMNGKLELRGELAWEGNGDQVGVRFVDTTDEDRNILRDWLKNQSSEPEPDDPPLTCVLTDMSLGACYLSTTSPFPRGTRVTLSINTAALKIRATGLVLVAHPEFGMGVEFLQTTTEQREQVRRMIATLRENGHKSPEIQVAPDGLVTASPGDSLEAFQSAATRSRAAAEAGSDAEDTLVDLFRFQHQAPVETFLQYMRDQRQSASSAASNAP